MSGSCIFDAVEKGATIALFSPPSSSELFYLCNVLDMKVAKEDICDIYNHAVSKGGKYHECQYYEKSAEKKGFIQYKLLKPIIFFCSSSPCVNASCKYDTNDMRLTGQEYLNQCYFKI